MEIGSSSHEKVELFGRGWWWLKALAMQPAEKLKAMIVGVVQKIIEVGKDDPRRVIHSLKVGIALTLVSLIYYFRPLYDGFGAAGMWAVLTVVVVFEFTVGATLGKGLNRVFATLLAGALGVGAHQLASLCGHKGEPIILGLSTFLLAAASTFSRFFPRIKQRYDYGVVIFILTFSLVSVSGYRVDKIIELAHQRLSTIIIGGLTCVTVSIFICPVWAGEDLHHMVAQNMEKIACFLEGFGEEYFSRSPEDGDNPVIPKNQKPFLEAYKSVLNSKATEESLVNFARWEPGHGRFRFRHPWKHYLLIGTLNRQCAYLVEALNGCINSKIQAPSEFQNKIQKACTDMSLECGKALKELALAMTEMRQPYLADPLVESANNAASDLKATLKTAFLENSDLLAIMPGATVASLLVEIVHCTEKITESVHELANLAHFKKLDPTNTPEKPHLLHRGTIKPVSGDESPHVVIIIPDPPATMTDIANPTDHECVNKITNIQTTQETQNCIIIKS
ncbi:aluminum-activated malate transporter 8 [Macadamia integrifolia]|uniref:aluminum-activated malate transporter 8 n=1 Tax=Macadamia integrifolia TaxID=60698 RepID=UPI001C4F22FB|nr:aluminum-activated malate transporter 8 [Macadamia integrifolia]